MQTIFRKICPWKLVILVIRLLVCWGWVVVDQLEEAGPENSRVLSYLVIWWIVIHPPSPHLKDNLGWGGDCGSLLGKLHCTILSGQVIWLISYLHGILETSRLRKPLCPSYWVIKLFNKHAIIYSQSQFFQVKVECWFRYSSQKVPQAMLFGYLVIW